MSAGENETNVGAIVATLRIDGDEWRRVLEEAKRQAEDLGRVNPDIRISTNAAESQRQIRELQTQLDALRADNVTIRLDLDEAQRQLARLREEARVRGSETGRDFASAFKRTLQAGIASIPKIDVDADTDPADIKLQEIRARMEALSRQKIGVDITTAEAMAKMRALQLELDKLRAKTKDRPDIKFNTAQASAELAKLRAELAALNSAAKSSGEGGGGPGAGGTIVGVLVGALTLIGPLTAAAVAGTVELGAVVGAAALAYKGLRDEEERQTATGIKLQAQFHGIGSAVERWETIAARQAGPGVLGALSKIRAFMPELDGDVSVLSRHLGNALNIGAGGTVSALRVLRPLLSDAGGYAESLAQKWANFAASPEFAQFVAYARRELPIIAHDLGDLVTMGVHLATALQPYGDNLLIAIDRTSQLISKTSDLLKLTQTNADASGGDASDIFGFQKRYQDSKGKKDKGALDYVNIALGAGNPYADAGKAKQSAAAAAQNAQAQQMVDVYTRRAADAMRQEESALRGVAAQYGLSVPAYQAAIENQKKQAEASAAATAQMRLESDAGGLLKDALDKLSGKQLSAAQTQNRFEQALVSMVKHTTKADAAVTGLSSSAIQNRGDLLNLVTAAQDAAEAYGSMDKSGLKTRQRLVDLRQQIIDNAVANGENRKAVTAYIDSVLKIPPAAVTKVDVDEAAAARKLAAFKVFLKTLPSSIRTAVELAGVASAEYQLQLLARNRTAKISVVTAGGATYQQSVGGRQVFADGGQVRGEGGPREDKVLIRASPGERIVPNGPSQRYAALLDHIIAGGTLPRYADGGTVGRYASGGIVTITPSKPKSGSSSSGGSSSSKTAKAKKSQKPKQVIVPISVVLDGGHAVGITSAIRGQIPSTRQAMRELSSAVNDAFSLVAAQRKVEAVTKQVAGARAKLARDTSARNDFIGSTRGNLQSVDITKYGDAGQLDDVLSNTTAGNAKFAAQIKALAKRGVPTSILAQLGTGPSAGLDTLSGENAAQLKKTIGLYTKYLGSADTGGRVAANAVYGGTLAADTRSVANLTRQLAADKAEYARRDQVFDRALLTIAQLVKRPLQIKVDGKVIGHAIYDAGGFVGVMDDLTKVIKGRR